MFIFKVPIPKEVLTVEQMMKDESISKLQPEDHEFTHCSFLHLWKDCLCEGNGLKPESMLVGSK